MFKKVNGVIAAVLEVWPLLVFALYALYTFLLFGGKAAFSSIRTRGGGGAQNMSKF